MRRLRGLLAGAVALLAGRGDRGRRRACAAELRPASRHERGRPAVGRTGPCGAQLDRSLLLAREAVNLDDSAATAATSSRTCCAFPPPSASSAPLTGTGWKGSRLARTASCSRSEPTGAVLFFDTGSRKEVGAFSVPPDPQTAPLAFNDDAVVAFQPHGSLLAVAAGGHSRCGSSIRQRAARSGRLRCRRRREACPGLRSPWTGGSWLPASPLKRTHFEPNGSTWRPDRPSALPVDSTRLESGGRPPIFT